LALRAPWLTEPCPMALVLIPDFEALAAPVSWDPACDAEVEA
jgi:hypothetical protein